MERPKIHFAPAKNWMNDPNGTVFDGEKFHLFYQYNPQGSDWGNIQWAYATSENLIDWTRKGIKLAPDIKNGERYCFSGCATKVQDGYKIYYTSIGFEDDAVQRRAKQFICDADESFSEIKRNGCGIFSDIHPFPVVEWRDPFVFEWNGTHYMVMAGISDRGHIFLYRATDKELNHWVYEGILFTPEYETDIPECPNVAVFGKKIVLLYSLAKENVVKYAVGEFDGKTFTLLNEDYVDYGVNCFYATNLATGFGGEVVLFGWQKESLIGTSSVDGTYSGCLAIPRIMRLNGNKPEFHFTNSLLSLYKRDLSVTTFNGKAVCNADAEISRITFTADKNSKVEILKSEHGSVLIEFGEGKTKIIRNSLTKQADERELEVKSNGKNFVEIVCDGTIVEMLVNNLAVSFRFYRQNKIKTLFRQLEGNVSDVRVAELSAAKFSEE